MDSINEDNADIDNLRTQFDNEKLAQAKAGYLEKEAHQMPIGLSRNAGNVVPEDSTKTLSSQHDTIVH